jgi:NADH-quinone oxidoreductase subunit L
VSTSSCAATRSSRAPRTPARRRHRRRDHLLYGAIVGCAKDDIKKALAASTMSQIGYMMLAAGLGPVGYAFAIFHLITHGFFKAGMFLGAGSVMHGMNDQVDMRRFGNLSGVMKITWITFGLGWLAILGVPPFSGFWSKDKIIEAAFIGEGWRPWVFGGWRPCSAPASRPSTCRACSS